MYTFQFLCIGFLSKMVYNSMKYQTMLNRKPLSLFQSYQGLDLLRPLYDQYSFAQLHATLISLLTHNGDTSILSEDCFGGKYPKVNQVVVFFIDALGWRFWEKTSQSIPAWQKVIDKATVTPISSLFPSTTAACVSTFHFGTLPAQHTLIEWNLFIKEYDETIQTLLFAPPGVKEQDYLEKVGYDPSFLIKKSPSLYEKLDAAGVKCYQFMPGEYVFSVYNQMLGRHTTPKPYQNIDEGFQKIKETLEQDTGDALFTFYYGDIDKASHRFGPDAPETTQKIAAFWESFDRVFGDYEKRESTLFVFFADHGQTSVDPNKTFFLNKEIPELINMLERNKKGQPIIVNGSPRDVFLHICSEKVDEAHALLRERLQGKALVLLTNEVLEQGLFGPGPFDPQFLERLGQIVILPLEDNSVWWYAPGVFSMDKHGHHGGLTKDELLTVFATY
jgi:predicted AlkP superfamily pyrophosphatase or phosphodiesterase